MADVQMLIEMGFPKEKAELALQVTNHKGVEPAMEWLLAHAGEEIPTSASINVAPATANTATPTTSDENPEAAKIDENADGSGTEPEAKSLKCDECGRLFKNQLEVEFHAAKSGHSSFSESTEEKKPLTEDERKAQLALVEAKIKQKRLEREECEKKEALERERVRIKSGKDMLEAKARMEELEMKKIMDQRKREKAEEKAARERVRAQIESDKAARKARAGGGQPDSTVTAPVLSPIAVSPPQQAAATSTVTSSTSINKPKVDYASTRIQIRLQDGSALTQSFDAKEQLSAVRLFVQLKLGNDIPFGLMTSFPRKVFDESDYEKPLEILGLVPSAVIIVTKS